MATITLKVDGMTCGGCEKSVSNALLGHEGVSNVNASHEAGTVTIDFDAAAIDESRLATAVEDAGFDVTG